MRTPLPLRFARTRADRLDEMSDAVRRRARLSLPFAAIAALGVALVPLPGEPLERSDWIAGGLLVLGIWLAIVLAPWERIPARWQLAPIAGSLLAVALLRDATGGAAGGLGVLVLLPVVWVALYGDRLQLHVVNLGTAAVWAYPLVVVGAPKYPAAGWRTAALFVALAWMIGASVQDLVSRRRADAADLRERHRERERLLARLAALAATDDLTGLANRRAWDEALDALVAGGEPFALALFDLDGFKRLNDERGHQVGDRVLKSTAAAWEVRLERGDVLARLGGDEFGLLAPGRSPAQAGALVDSLLAASAGIVGCSAGVALWGGESPGDLQGRADELLYAAKRAGGGRTRADRPARPLDRR
jgi:diguanylate cyclase (GGDEF)-like protein